MTTKTKENTTTLTLADKLALARKELNRASKASEFYNRPLVLKEIRFLDNTTMATQDKGNITLKPVRWFCLFDDEGTIETHTMARESFAEVTIETYTMACESFAEELIKINDGQPDFSAFIDGGTPVWIEFYGQYTKRNLDIAEKSGNEPELSPAVKLV